MTTFLTVKQASQRTGKSTSSIRRIIYPILKHDDHADRAHIEPTPKDAMKLRMQGENFAWKLSEELLLREIKPDTGADKANANSSSKLSLHADGELFATLRRELDIKNQQITQQGELLRTQMELISGLNERLREGNILILSLQQRLALTDGRERKDAEPLKSKRAPPLPPQKSMNRPAPIPAKPKHSFLVRLFQSSK